LQEWRDDCGHGPNIFARRAGRRGTPTQQFACTLHPRASHRMKLATSLLSFTTSFSNKLVLVVESDLHIVARNTLIGHRITVIARARATAVGVGSEYLHLAIDDHSRVAYSEILPNEKHRS
jgi:hypothetical protein